MIAIVDQLKADLMCFKKGVRCANGVARAGVLDPLVADPRKEFGTDLGIELEIFEVVAQGEFIADHLARTTELRVIMLVAQTVFQSEALPLGIEIQLETCAVFCVVLRTETDALNYADIEMSIQLEICTKIGVHLPWSVEHIVTSITQFSG